MYLFVQGAMFVYDITNEDSFRVMDQMVNGFKKVSEDAVYVYVTYCLNNMYIMQ